MILAVFAYAVIAWLVWPLSLPRFIAALFMLFFFSAAMNTLHN